MSIGLEIRIDAPGALPTIAGVQSAVDKLEQSAPKAGAAMSQALAAGAPAADKTKQAAATLAEQMQKLANTGKAFSGLDEVFKREADMLQKINGPAKEYAANLQALDTLLEKGSISTDQYASQVTKMNQAIEDTGRKSTQAGSGADKLSGALAAIALPAVASQILGLGEKIGSLVAESEHMSDTFINLQNKSLKFTDALHDSNQILAEQTKLSVDLHTTMEPTIALFDKVRIGSDGMRMSHEQMIRATKTLGEAAITSNKSIEDAAGIMDRFSFAMESGVTSVRDVKTVMREMPDIAKLWRDSFHESDAQILSDIERGKKGARELATAFYLPVDALKNLDNEAAKRLTTADEKAKQWVEQVAKIKESQNLTGMQAVQYANLEANQNLDPEYRSRAEHEILYGNDADAVMNGEKGQAAINQMLLQAQDITNLTGQWTRLGIVQDKFIDGITWLNKNGPAALGLIGNATENLLGKFGDLVVQLGKVDAWSTDNSFARALKIYGDSKNQIDDAKQQLVALNLALKNGLGADAYAKQYRELMTTINDGRLPAMIKIWDSLHEPMRTAKEDLAATNALWHAGSLSALDYQYELLQLQKTDPGLARFNEVLADSVKRYDAAAAAAKRYRDAALYTATPGAIGLDTQTFAATNRQSVSDAGTFKAIQDTESAKQDEQAKRYQEVIDASATSVDKYYDELAKLNTVQSDGTLTADQYNTALTGLKEKYGAATSPAEKFAKEIQEANGLLGAGVLTITDYTRRMQEIAKEQEKLADSGKDFASGVSRGFHSIRDEVTDVASTISATMKSAFDEINTDIVDSVTKGSADWSKLATDIEGDFTKLALQSVESSLFSGLTKSATDTAGAATTGVATGTSAATTMLAAAPGIGAAIGATAAAAIAAGSAVGGAVQGAGSVAADAIGGSWAGSQTMIHAANGYAGKVRGVAGVDTKLFAAMVSPGEDVTIRTPQQRAADARSNSSSSGPTIINKFDTRGDLAAAHADGSLDTPIINVLKRNKGLVQQLIKK